MQSPLASQGVENKRWLDDRIYTDHFYHPFQSIKNVLKEYVEGKKWGIGVRR